MLPGNHKDNVQKQWQLGYQPEWGVRNSTYQWKNEWKGGCVHNSKKATLEFVADEIHALLENIIIILNPNCLIGGHAQSVAQVFL